MTWTYNPLLYRKYGKMHYFDKIKVTPTFATTTATTTTTTTNSTTTLQCKMRFGLKETKCRPSSQSP